MKIIRDNDNNKIFFRLIPDDNEDIVIIENKVKNELTLYCQNTLYNRLRFEYGIVHGGYYFLNQNEIIVVFTTIEKYFDQIESLFCESF